MKLAARVGRLSERQTRCVLGVGVFRDIDVLNDNRKAALQILPGLQYLAWAAHDSGAEPVSGWIGETIARIVDWAECREPVTPRDSGPAVRAALAEVLGEARRLGLEETVRRLED